MGKSQRLFSFLSHLQKNHPNHCLLNYSYLLYHVCTSICHTHSVQCRSVDSTIIHCISSSLHLEQQSNVKNYSGITVNLITVVYCTLQCIWSSVNSQNTTLSFQNIHFIDKVWTFWEEPKILKNLPLKIW